MGAEKILVVGLGSIARRHIANIIQLRPSTAIMVLRHREAVLPDAVAGQVEGGTTSVEDALAWRPDAVLITGPSSMHVASAIPFASCGAHILIEKPLSSGMDDVPLLLAACRQGGGVLMVAYNFRYSSSMRRFHQAAADGLAGSILHVRAEAGQYLPDWRPSTPYRESVSARRALGGGVLLELSHEIDYVRWLGGEVTSVSALVGKQSDLDLDVEDTADLLLTFAGGATGHVHVDMIQRKPARACKVVGSEGTLRWDGITGEVLFDRPGGAGTEVLHSAGAEDRNEMYVEEMKHFFACCEGRAEPQASGRDGAKVLEIIEAARRSAQTGTRVTL